MKRLLRIAGVVLIALASIAAVAGVTLYVVSERFIHRTYAVALEPPIDIPTDAASIAEGERLAHIRGCNGGCHGKKGVGGRVWDEGWLAGHAMAPDIAKVARTYSTPELARVIRRGVRANGESVQIMPSPMFYHLSDADLGRIIAFLRSTPVTDANAYAFNAGPMWRWQMAKGEWTAYPDDIAKMGARIAPADPADSLHYGEYLARTSCSECHGDDLAGHDGTPNLTVAAAYAPADFSKLMRTGVALGGRELELMSDVARTRFHYFTDSEIEALHAFLRHRAEGTGPSSP